ATANNQAAINLFSVALRANDPSGANLGTGVVLGLTAQGLTPSTGKGLPRWVEFGQNLPNAIVSALSYTPAFKSPAGATVGDVLLVALRGRGVWKLTSAAFNVANQTELTITGDANNNVFALRIDPDHPLPLDQWVDVYQLDQPASRQFVGTYPLKE